MSVNSNNSKFFCKMEYRTPESKYCFATPWSVIHIISGIVITVSLLAMFYNFTFKKVNSVFWSLFILGVIANLLHLIYELEDIRKMNNKINGKTPKGGSFYYNSWVNTLGDTFFAFLGSLVMLFIATKYPISYKTAFFAIMLYPLIEWFSREILFKKYNIG